MAEVEQGAAPARLVLVLADDARFRGYRMRDRVHPRLGIAREQRGAVRLAPREEFGIVDQPVFDDLGIARAGFRSEEHTSELQSLMRISYAVFCLKKKKQKDELPQHM